MQCVRISCDRWMKGALGMQSIVGVGVTAETTPIVLSLLVIWAALLSSILFYFIFQIKDRRL